MADPTPGATRTGRAGRPGRGQAWWDIPVTIAIAVGAVLLITTFVAKPFSIPSGSMEDTLQVGDRVLALEAAIIVLLWLLGRTFS